VDTKTLAKLDRLLKKFPETWVHTRETTKAAGGVEKTFHHVDYKSGVEGRPRVRLVSYVSSDMCELLVTLKSTSPDLLALAQANLAAKASSKTPKNTKRKDA
jgi:hypothetical protein